MRAGARWHRAERARTPQEIASAAAFTAFRLSRAMLASMRKASFAIEAGPGYFDFLAEALAFCIQCACRIAWPRLPGDQRQAFVEALAHHAAAHLAQNEAELVGARSDAEVRRAFIERLNARFAEYAGFDYGPEGPGFAFVRFFASLVAETVPPEDARWIHDQVIAIEGPVAASAMARTVGGLLDSR